MVMPEPPSSEADLLRTKEPGIQRSFSFSDDREVVDSESSDDVSISLDEPEDTAPVTALSKDDYLARVYRYAENVQIYASVLVRLLKRKIQRSRIYQGVSSVWAFLTCRVGRHPVTAAERLHSD